jgi:DNA mismatch endonuclease (patch repair protein)
MTQVGLQNYSMCDRSETMRRVKSQDTGAEMAVRRLLHAEGYRYRLHSKKLPGKPDIVFASRKKVIFVHGCFWHQHPGCVRSNRPSSNTDYWTKKLDRNVARDSENITQIIASGWRVLVLWECQIRDKRLLLQNLKNFLDKGD